LVETLVKVEVGAGSTAPAELHVYGKGDHGFSLAHDTGHSTEKWPSTFIDWLRDMEMIESGPGKG
jgi:hypothetical protein